MTQAQPEPGGPAAPARGALAAEAARGAGVVLAAELLGRAARLATTWYLSGALGAAAFGRFTSATTLLLVLSAPLPLGLDLGMVYFGARHLERGERAAWRATLRAGAALAAVASAMGGLLLWAVCQTWLANLRPALAADLARLAPAFTATGLLLFLVGVLRAHRAMAAQALSYQIALPFGTLAGTALAAGLGYGLGGVLTALAMATALTAGLAAWQAWHRTRDLRRECSVRCDLGRLLAWSLPQSLETTLFRTTQWMDVLMLTALCAAPDVGTYRVALALALLCQIPVMALVTALNPMLAALIERGERARLEGLVRAATRWLLLLVAPVALALLLVPDLALAPFDPAYVAGIPSLRLLLPGVVVLAISAPTLRLIPMGGHARLNLLDHLGAAGLNAGLNLWLIPRLGPRGAALATSVSFGLWALVALLQARHLLGCLAWDRRNLAVAGALLTFGAGALAVGVEAPAAARLALLCACCAGLAALVWRLGLAEEDIHVLRLLRARLGVDRA